MVEKIEEYLEELFPNSKCELNYNKDYELLIAVVLSAQTTDKRVNMVTKELFSKYPSIEEVSKASVDDLIDIVKPLGTASRKGVFVHEIAKILVDKYNGIVPNNRKALESMPGVGRKTANVVLSNLFDVPCIAVDTHVSRVSKRLFLAKEDDSVEKVEEKLKRKFKRENWSKRHHQMVLFGRYHCMARNPNCESCKLKDFCKYNKRKEN
ncbi:MAG: endonuclease III [Firmicutes bacterium]|nr:endonuclease III [Bacillota bacterium]